MCFSKQEMQNKSKLYDLLLLTHDKDNLFIFNMF